jgi:hypothetical protein
MEEYEPFLTDEEVEFYKNLKINNQDDHHRVIIKKLAMEVAIWRKADFHQQKIKDSIREL